MSVLKSSNPFQYISGETIFRPPKDVRKLGQRCRRVTSSSISKNCTRRIRATSEVTRWWDEAWWCNVMLPRLLHQRFFCCCPCSLGCIWVWLSFVSGKECIPGWKNPKGSGEKWHSKWHQRFDYEHLSAPEKRPFNAPKGNDRIPTIQF